MANLPLKTDTIQEQRVNPLRVAYIMKEYPRLSETFIMNEICLLGKMGLNITVFSVKQPP